ncbi:MAG: EAL domain-containing protein [Candidatus Eremiobacteraeota bacterium]|nr:EAL domain-containing protein [Candidatus Eremiobacteraeota bacterium]
MAIVGPDGRVRYCNSQTRELLGDERLEGTNLPFPAKTGTVCLDGIDEVPVNLMVRANRIDWAGEQCQLVLLQEVGGAWAAEETERLAFEDSLTGLPNLNIISQFMEFTLTQARRYERAAALLVLDLDRFKVVNEALGMAAGDDLLCQVALRLQSMIRSSDIIGRRGEDEFLILLTELSDERSSADAQPISVMDRAATVACRIIDGFSEPFQIGDQEYHVGTSIGVSLCPHDATNSQQMLGHADSAMYHAKELGRGRYQFYTPDLQERHQRRLTIESGLHQALKRNEFQLYYQPIVDLQSEAVVGVEALLRWKRGKEILPAAEFIRIAEESGLIVSIGEWVFEEACAQAAAWKAQGRNLFVSVNLSARQLLNPRLVSHLAETLAAHDIEPQAISLDIREDSADLDQERSGDVFAALAEKGVRIAIDDFGTGLSSLRQIRRSRADLLKVDRSLICDITDDGESRTVVAAILSLARSLSLKTLAEGIESEAQKALCQANGCQFGQGHLFSEPLPPKRLEKYLNKVAK